jgi:prevent-host-death family protein
MAVLSVTEAAARGVAALVRDAGAGDVVVSRHGKPVAAVVSMARLAELREVERDLRDLLLVVTRAAADTGERVGLDEAFTAFGVDRATLVAELAEDEAAGRE